MIPTKYLILLWIVILVVFTFFCIYRLSILNPQPTNKFVDIEQSPQPPQPSQMVIPNTTSQNIIDYISAEQSKDKITDIPGCQNVYDDNIAVRSL